MTIRPRRARRRGPQPGCLCIPGDVVRSVRFGGPDLLPDDYPPGAVEIVSPTGPAVAQRLVFRTFHDDDLVATFPGTRLPSPGNSRIQRHG